MFGRNTNDFIKNKLFSPQNRAFYAGLGAGQNAGVAWDDAGRYQEHRDMLDMQQKQQQMLFQQQQQDRLLNNNTRHLQNKNIQSQIDYRNRPRGVADLPADLQAFNTHTQGMSEDDVKKARRIHLGLESRAPSASPGIEMIGGVPYQYNPRTQQMSPVKVMGSELDANAVSDNAQTVEEGKEFGKETGKFNAKTLSDAYGSFGKANGQLYNIKQAITALENGARVGILDRYAPSIRASSVELDNIRNQMGLDVIGAVTFGALSKGELDIALATAMPNFANETDALDWLQRRALSQEKLMGYYQEQMRYIQNGGSVVDFVTSRGGPRDTENLAPTNTQKVTAPATKQSNGEANVPMPTKINNDEDYSKLPSGTTFIAPDGSTRVKP